MPRRVADWRDDAACLHADTDLFFPVGKTGRALVQVDEAKRVCATCPVQAQCLACALDLNVVTGVWGGSTEEERRTMRRTATTKPLRRASLAQPEDCGGPFCPLMPDMPGN